MGRYANRIKNGTFTLDGEEYHTPLNEKDMQTLHGGDLGFNRLNWTLADKGKDHISFNLVSRDGDEGFPGTVDVTVTCLYRIIIENSEYRRRLHNISLSRPSQ